MVTLSNGAPDETPISTFRYSDRYYGVAEAASYLGVSRVTVWRWIRAGRLPASHLGHRTVRIRRRDLDRLLLGPSQVCGEHSRVLPAEAYSTLDDADARLREIALLQQKALSLELEVAARQGTELALRQREAELRDFFEQGMLGLHWVDAQGTIVWANQAELDLLGVSADEYIGRHIGGFYADRAEAEDILARLSRRELIRDREVRLRRKDGSIRYALVSSNVLWDGDTFIHTRCFTVDITQRKLAERRLELQSAVSSVLSEATSLEDAAVAVLSRVCVVLGWAAGGYWVVDEHAGVLRCEAFWRSSGDLSGFQAATFDSQFTAGSGLPGRVWSTAQPAWLTDVTHDRNFPRAASARATSLHSAFAFPISLGDDVLGVAEFFSHAAQTPDEETLALMAGIGQQMGQFVERKRAEATAELERQRLREIFERAPAAVAIVCGPEHTFEYVNPECLRMAAAQPASAVIGRRLQDVLPELVEQGYTELLDRVYQSGAPFVANELRVELRTRGQGGSEEIFLNILLHPLRDEAAAVEGILLHAVDVTEQVRARRGVEQLANQLQDQLDSHVQLNAELRDAAEARDLALEHLQQLLKARDEFLASAAHDLKNPLATVKA